MDTLTMAQVLQKNGPFALALIVVCVLLFFVLKWVFKNQDRILTMANNQNESWQARVAEQADSFKEFYTRVKSDHAAQREANAYQRQEHKDLAEQHVKICASLTETTTILKSLNGKG